MMPARIERKNVHLGGTQNLREVGQGSRAIIARDRQLSCLGHGSTRSHNVIAAYYQSRSPISAKSLRVNRRNRLFAE